MAPDDATTIESVILSIGQHLQGDALLVDGYFNAKLAALEGNPHEEGIAAALEAAGLEYMS